jgi:hypothetical protein
VFFDDGGAIDSVATDGTGLRVLSTSAHIGDRLFGQTGDELLIGAPGWSLLSKKDGTIRVLTKALYQPVIATADALYGVRGGNAALELVRISLLDGQPTVLATLDPIVISASLVASNGFVYAIGNSMSIGSGFDTLRVSRVDGHVERFVRPFGADAWAEPGGDGIVYGIGFIGPSLGRWPDASSKPEKTFATNAVAGSMVVDELAAWVDTTESVIRFGFDGSRATVIEHLYQSYEIAMDAKCIYVTMPGSLLRFPK